MIRVTFTLSPNPGTTDEALAAQLDAAAAALAPVGTVIAIQTEQSA